jgi:hypothetical protein
MTTTAGHSFYIGPIGSFLLPGERYRLLRASGLNVWTTHMPMRNYREIHCRFLYKAKEGRHIRIKLTITNNTTSQQNNDTILLL